MSSEKKSTRNRILKAAWTLLEDGGGNAVRMSDIAKAAKISRQAVYLHFPTRAELLIATTRYVDEVKNVETRFAASRSSKNGFESLDIFIEAWGNYIPEIYGVAKALLAMKDSDEAAEAAWRDRMLAVRGICNRVVNELASEGMLLDDYSVQTAVDILWTMMSVRNWEQLTVDCGWSQKKYIDTMKVTARQTLLAN